MLAIAGAGIVGVLAVRASLPRLQYPIFAVSCSLAIVSVVARRTSVITPFLAAPPTVMLGRLSYGIYLWHMIAAVWIDHIPGLEQMPYEGALRFALMLGSGILLAAASRRWIEAPFLRMKNKLRAASHDPGLSSSAGCGL